jgi:hypothetical protein
LALQRIFFKSIVKRGFLSEEVLLDLQHEIDNAMLPSHIPRPNITSLSNFNAAELKSFFIVLGPALLPSRIPKAHFQLFSILSRAIRLLSCRVLSLNEVAEIHELFTQYAAKFRNLYTELAMTPNLHI